MHSKTLALTTAMVAALFAISACNKSATPAANPAAPVANAAVPATTPAATVAPLAATPAPVVANPAPMGRGERMGRGGGGGGGRGRLKAACAADIAKFCTAGERPGRCLRPHAAELSPACQQARAEAKAARKARKAGGAE